MLAWAVFAVAAMVVAVALFCAFFDWNRARGFINDRVSNHIGREFAIRGDLAIDFSLAPLIRAADVVIANAPWGSRPHMVEIASLALRVRLLPLLIGRVIIPNIELTRPHIVLERGPRGQANWHFARQDQDGGRPPSIGYVGVHDGMLRYRAPVADTDISIAVTTRPAATHKAERRLVVNGTGTFHGERFTLDAHGGELLSIRSTADPYPLDIAIAAGRTRFSARGTLINPLQLAGTDILVTLEGADLAHLQDFYTLPFPATPAYRIEGRLEHAERWWRLRDFDGVMGTSQIGGDLALELAGARPLIQAKLVSRGLDLEDLTGLLGAPPGEGLAESGKKRRGRLLPEHRFDLPRLNAVDAAVTFNAARIKTRWPIADLYSELSLKNGVFSLSPLRVGIARGALEGIIRLDARRPAAEWNVDLTVRNVDLHRLTPNIQQVEAATARMGGHIKINARGNSIAAMAGHADGDIGLVITQAEVSKLLVSLASLDITRTITSFFGDEKQLPLNCAVADFKVQNGTAVVETFVIDTAQTDFYGQGTLNLRQEKLDLTLHPRPQRPTLSARAPLKISGSMLNPDVEIERQALAKGAAAVALGALVAPLAGLVPLIDPGPAQEHACSQLIERVKRQERAGAGQDKD